MEEGTAFFKRGGRRMTYRPTFSLNFIPGRLGKIGKVGKAVDAMNDLTKDATVLNAVDKVGDTTRVANAVDKLNDSGKVANAADKATEAGRLADKVDDIGDASKANKPYEMHHYATDKNKTYTPDIKKITDKYGLDLDGSWNKELLPHKGRHPNAYHEDVLQESDDFAEGNQKLFLELFEKNVKQKVRENPEMLYKEYWRNLGQ